MTKGLMNFIHFRDCQARTCIVGEEFQRLSEKRPPSSMLVFLVEGGTTQGRLFQKQKRK